MGMRMAAIAAVVCFAMPGWAATPEAADVSLVTVRVTTGEVHVALTAVRDKNQPVTDLSTSDFVVLRDGQPIDKLVSFGSYHEAPYSAVVLVDVSDSMLPGLPLEREASSWLQAMSDPARDQLSFLDFGFDLQSDKKTPEPKHHLTSLYDAVMETLPTIDKNSKGRRALILFTDGDDNYSYHSLGDVIARAHRFDIAIYAVIAHPGKRQYFRPEVLQKLCDETGGKYYAVRKPAEMQSAVSQIDHDLRNGYELVFRPDSASAGLHQLTIRPAHDEMRFFYRSAYFQPSTSGAELALGK